MSATKFPMRGPSSMRREPRGEPALGRHPLGELDLLRRAALRHPVEGGEQIGNAEPEGERVARPDGEGLDRAAVGVADDAAPVEDDAGVGQRLGEELDPGLGPDLVGRLGTAGSGPNRSAGARGTRRGKRNDRRQTGTPPSSAVRPVE